MNFAQLLLALAGGAGYTLLVTSACIATGLCSGLGIAFLGRLQIRPIQWLISLHLAVFRGVPVLVLLFIMYFGLPAFGIRLPALIAIMLSLGLVSGAYLAEVFRGALASVDEHEILAAQAMGMRRTQILRAIEIPQMLRFAVPGMLNEFTSVLKYSPFAYTVGIPEIMKEAMGMVATTLRGVEIYFAVGLLYFGIYRLMLAGVRLMERRFHVPGFNTL